jgi:bacteriorhodopsin
MPKHILISIFSIIISFFPLFYKCFSVIWKLFPLIWMILSFSCESLGYRCPNSNTVVVCILFVPEAKLVCAMALTSSRDIEFQSGTTCHHDKVHFVNASISFWLGLYMSMIINYGVTYQVRTEFLFGKTRSR